MGHLSINLVLMVVLLLDGEDILVCEEDVFVPVLGVPLEEMLCSCRSDRLHSRSKGYVPLGGGAHSCIARP